MDHPVAARGGMTPQILVVDDDPLILEQLETLLAGQTYRITTAGDAAQALQNLSEREFTLAVVDMKIPGSDGIALTREIRERWPSVDVVMITGYGSIRGAVEAMKHGASDYITKPFEPEEILLAIQKVLERRRLIDEIEYLRKQLSDRYTFGNMVTRNPAMIEVFSTIEMLAQNDVTVLVCGESGTGKELVARAIHFQGKRRAGRFVAINCAALPEPLLESELFGFERGAFTGALQDRVGKIELANGGTLFLDEVESIPLAMQVKLLRVLQDRAIEKLGGNKIVLVDMRVVAATNRDLAALVASGQLREDFYYRINVVPVQLPPLRERLEDIALLVADFLRNNLLAREKGINRLSERALAQLMGHSWPGNVRELLNVLERAVLRAKGDTVREVDIPGEISSPNSRRSGADYQAPLREFLRRAEREYLNHVLARYHGGIGPSARHAMVDQATLHRKIKAHGLHAGEFRANGRTEGGGRPA
ncbi:MAG: sigma-54-dependent Fis family transcriptional regulator [Deltaproteobacteria bacterium]|nr:sigma-54-dependent Fis family transcriptional regulator [Deltaproteobacteria bacterium]